MIEKVAKTSDRLSYVMNERGLTQKDLVQLTGCSSQTISSWVTGIRNPNQDGIYKLACALNVSEAWLMGLDVSIARIKQETDYTHLISLYESLNQQQQELIINMMAQFKEANKR